MKKLLLSVLFMVVSIVAAHAVDTATVVSSCGTPPTTYTAGQPFPLTQSTTGLQCSSASLSGSVTANTTAKATAAAPSYSEGTDNPLSQTLTGNLRVTGVGGSFPVTAASGALASGSVASGAVASGAYVSGSISAGAIADGGSVTLGAKADAKSTATDTTPISVVSVLKEISAMVQAPASTPVTNVGTFAVQAQPTPVTSGGLSWYTVQPAASDNHFVIKVGAGQVYHISVTNNSATINYMRLYNATTGFNGCNSATNLVYSQEIPASTSAAGFVEDISQGIAFATGISICITSVYGNTDTTNATATAMQVNVGYK